MRLYIIAAAVGFLAGVVVDMREERGSETGYTLRTTAKWLDGYGAPICPCCQEVMAQV